MIIKIGSAADNDIVLDDPSISRHHAEIEIKENKYYVIRDLRSKNGIRVNSRRIRKTRLEQGDELLLGDYRVDIDDFLTKVRAIYNRSRTDFTEEYRELFEKLKEYEMKKDKIMKAPLLPIVIRVGLGVMVIVILIAFPNAIPNDGVRLGLIMLTGIVSASAATFISRTSTKRDKLDRLRLEYEDILVCPKCTSTLINHTLTYLMGKGRCINAKCDATYKIE